MSKSLNPTLPVPSPYYVPGLDGLRAVAVSMVYAMHALPLVTADWFAPFRQVGNFGVPIFFVLSGYLITTLMQRELDLTKGFEVGAFYLRRILRIWPLYFLSLLVGGFVVTPYLTDGGSEKTWLLKFALFVGNGFIGPNRRPQPHTGVLWSVCVEEQFYLVWPVICALGKRNGMLIASIMAIICSMAYRYFNSDLVAENYNLWFKSLTHIESLGWGAILALKGIDVKPRPVLWVAGPALVVLGALMVGPIHSSPTPSGAFGYTLASMGAVALIINAREVNSLLSHPWLVFVGKISFGCYIYHLIILMILNKGTTQSWQTFALGIPLTLGVSYFSHRFYESRFIRLKRKLQRVESGS